MVRGSIASDTNVSFKQLCSPVAGPYNCVIYRDIRLLKAHSCSRRFSSNCVGDVAPKRSSGCGFVLTNLRHTSARRPPAQCVHLVLSASTIILFSSICMLCLLHAPLLACMQYRPFTITM